MWQKVAKIKGAEYFRKALYTPLVCTLASHHCLQYSICHSKAVSKQGLSINQENVRIKEPNCSLFFYTPQLEAEGRRLMELKQLNMQNVTEAIRSEIAVLWEKCFFSSDQQQAFVPYYSSKLGFRVLITG